MAAKQSGGLPAAGGYGESPFSIYRNALDFVMNSLSVDEDVAAEVIMNEFGTYANEWQKLGIRSAAAEMKASHLPTATVDWGLAWLN